MTTTVTSDDSYVVWVDNDNDDINPGALRVVWGTDTEELLSVRQDGYVDFHGTVKCSEEYPFVSRANSGLCVQFDRLLQTKAKIDLHGRYICAEVRGFAVKKETALPTDSPVTGTTRALHDTSAGTYGLVGRLGSVWKTVNLPN